LGALGQQLHRQQVLRAHHLRVVVPQMLPEAAVRLRQDVRAVPLGVALRFGGVQVGVGQAHDAGVVLVRVELDRGARRLALLGALPVKAPQPGFAGDRALADAHGPGAGRARLRGQDAHVRAQLVVIESCQQRVVATIEQLLRRALRIRAFHLGAHTLALDRKLAKPLRVDLGSLAIALGLFGQLALHLGKLLRLLEIPIRRVVARRCRSAVGGSTDLAQHIPNDRAYRARDLLDQGLGAGEQGFEKVQGCSFDNGGVDCAVCAPAHRAGDRSAAPSAMGRRWIATVLRRARRRGGRAAGRHNRAAASTMGTHMLAVIGSPPARR
jgi:hypothetical protein